MNPPRIAPPGPGKTTGAPEKMRDAAAKKSLQPPKFIFARMIWSNLGVHPVRSALSAVAIGLQVFLILLIVGLTSGVLNDWSARVEGVGADLLVQSPNSSVFFFFAGAVMPQSLVSRIARLPGVDEVSPVIIMVDTRTFGVVYGIDYATFNGLSHGFTFLAGGPFSGPNDAIADSQVNLVAHETIEAITDPLGNAWFDAAGNEIGDKCAYTFPPSNSANAIASSPNKNGPPSSLIM